jgi:hypothetical protein
LVTGTGASALAGLFFNNTALDRHYGWLCCCGLLHFFIGRSQIRHKARPEDVKEQALDLAEKY